MARVTFEASSSTSPVWAGDFHNREHDRPGGAQLVAAGFTADANGVKFVPSGTAVGRTFAERAAGTGFGPAADADDEVYLTAYDVKDAVTNPDVTLYRHGGLVKENYLPGIGSMSAAVLAKIRAAYETIRGVN